MLLTSCAHVRPHQRTHNETDQSLSEESLSRIEGVYANKPDSNQHSLLWDRLVYRSKESPGLEKAVVKLNVAGPGRLNAALILNDSTIATKSFHFKYTKGYLNIKRQFKAKMFIGPIIWGLGDSKVFIGLSQNNDLVVINDNFGTAMLVFFPVFPAGGQRDADFRRVTQ